MFPLRLSAQRRAAQLVEDVQRVLSRRRQWDESQGKKLCPLRLRRETGERKRARCSPLCIQTHTRTGFTDTNTHAATVETRFLLKTEPRCSKSFRALFHGKQCWDLDHTPTRFQATELRKAETCRKNVTKKGTCLFLSLTYLRHYLFIYKTCGFLSEVQRTHKRI